MAETGFGSRDKGGYANAGPGGSRSAAAVKDKACEDASSFVGKAKDVAASAVSSTKDMASSVAHKVEDAASSFGNKVGGAVDSVGGEMKSLAGTLREKAPNSGMLGNAATSTADTLEAGGAYLQEHDFKAMADDLTGMVRRYPLQFILAGIGIGFLVGRSSRM